MVTINIVNSGGRMRYCGKRDMQIYLLVESKIEPDSEREICFFLLNRNLDNFYFACQVN